MAERRVPVVKLTDMPEDMQNEAHEAASAALAKYDMENDVAGHISAHFNKKFHPTWHCIVGRNFAANVTHETKNFTYFYLGQTGFLLWKSG